MIAAHRTLRMARAAAVPDHHARRDRPGHRQDRDRPDAAPGRGRGHDPAGRPRDRLRLGAVHGAAVGGRKPGGVGPEASWRQAAGRVSCSLSSRVPLARGMCSDAGEARGEGSSSDDVDASPTAHRDRCESLAGRDCRRATAGGSASATCGRATSTRSPSSASTWSGSRRPGRSDPAAGACGDPSPPCGTAARSSCPTARTTTSWVRRTRSAPTSPPRTSAVRTGWPSCVPAWPRPVWR